MLTNTDMYIIRQQARQTARDEFAEYGYVAPVEADAQALTTTLDGPLTATEEQQAIDAYLDAYEEEMEAMAR